MAKQTGYNLIHLDDGSSYPFGPLGSRPLLLARIERVCQLGSKNVRLKPEEAQCVRILANEFEKGTGGMVQDMRRYLREQGLDLDYKTYAVVMNVMEDIGAIENAQHNRADEGRYVMFRIAARAVELAREIEDRETEMQREIELLKWQEARKVEDDKRNDERRAEERQFQAQQNELNRNAQAEQNELNRKAQADQSERGRRAQFWLTILAAFLGGVGTLGGFLIGMRKEDPKEPQPIIINMPTPNEKDKPAEPVKKNEKDK